MPRFRFSLFRIFPAVTIFCVAFAYVKWIGNEQPFVPWLIGVSLAILVLLAKPQDNKVIVDTVKACGIGALFFAFFSLGFVPIIQPRSSGRNIIPIAMIIGAVFGWLMNKMLRSSDLRDKKEKAAAVSEYNAPKSCSEETSEVEESIVVHQGQQQDETSGQ